ncbi:ladderlectin-like [Scleropages formosus]|uniref:Ladderlectin-like n=1 Tax=Scleropages formosus TaxID=113540 RepID=A0A8C9SY82_SCLFO|nr:ladderlectin-like [Scleropages formosus]
MGPLSISVLLFTALVLSGGFAAPRAQEQREKSVIIEGYMENTSATQGCPSGWQKFNSRCFHYISQKTSWVHAQIHCIRFSASLASIHSLQEYRFVQNVTRRLGNNFPLAWIGGTDAPQEGKWIWVDGTPFDFTKWTPGEPNNRGGENCLEMNFGDQKLWNDISCKKYNPSVCARQAS